MEGFKFEINKEYGHETLARTGVMSTPHGEINTPAFVVVGTQATVKGMTPEQVSDVHAQAVLGNAYHLYLRPGQDVVEGAGGLGKFMGWPGPTFTDSGGFQVMSLGSGYKKVLSMESDAPSEDEVIAPAHQRRVIVDDDGVTFKSHIDGSKHRWTPEVSMQVQHALGADVIFAFDELTSLKDSYEYQVKSLARTEAWAKRSLKEIERLRKNDSERPYQALFAVIQGAQYENLRCEAASALGKLSFDGFGIGGAIEKARLAEIVRWANQELPSDKPKHMLGISEPDDIFDSIENGIDTFDCVSPTRVGRNGAGYTYEGRVNFSASRFKRDGAPLVEGCECYACRTFSRAYVRHLLNAKERLGGTLMSIHNEHFIIKLVDDIRGSIDDGSFLEFKEDWLKRYYFKKLRTGPEDSSLVS